MFKTNSIPKSIESYYKSDELNEIKTYIQNNQPTRLSLDLENIQKILQNKNDS